MNEMEGDAPPQPDSMWGLEALTFNMRDGFVGTLADARTRARPVSGAVEGRRRGDEGERGRRGVLLLPSFRTRAAAKKERGTAGERGRAH